VNDLDPTPREFLDECLAAGVTAPFVRTTTRDPRPGMDAVADELEGEWYAALTTLFPEEPAWPPPGENVRRAAQRPAPAASTPVLVVGEAPGRGNGEPLESAWRKLPALAYLDRVNLLSTYPGRNGKGAAFPIAEASDAAAGILLSVPADVPLVLMGARVALAFGIPRREYDWLDWFEWRGRSIAVCPHPSGIVRWWNDPENAGRAAAFFSGLAG
jgi:hypothetical protein